MFDSLFPKHWTTLQRLMWLKTNALARAVYETITGNPVSFTALAAPLRKLSIAFSPVQDLHGYDSPWPAGGWTNKLNNAKSGTTETIGVYTFKSNSDGSVLCSGTGSTSANFFLNETLTLKAGTYTLFALDAVVTTGTVRLYIYNNSTQAVVAQISLGTANASNTFTLAEDATLWCYINIASTGATFNGKTLYPMIVEGSTASAWTPYSNECPISGWDSLTVEMRGKNLLDQSSLVATGITYSDGVLTGRAAAFNFAYGTGGSPIPISVGASQLTLSLEAYTDGNASATGGGLIFRLVYDDGTYKQVQLPNSTSEFTSATVTSTSGKKVVGLWISYGAEGNNIWHVRNLQLELGSTATAYAPYNPLSRSISISLGSTYYSGWVDAITGIGEGDMDAADMGDLNWVRITTTTNPYFRVELPNRKDRTPIMCETYPVVSFGSLSEFGNSADDNTIGYSVLNKYIAVRADAYATASAFKTAVAGRKVAFKCAENISFTTTPTEVSSLLGDNVMWSDANGDLTVEYRSN